MMADNSFDGKVTELADILSNSNNIVFFGGAGVSTASGIPDFRSSDGLYSKKLGRNFSPEQAVSHSFFVNQNIDGLHQAAGSKVVYELHGSVLRNYCTGCHTFYDDKYVINAEGVPVCEKCGGVVKPDVVLYEESLDDSVVSGAINAISDADTLIIGGTSLIVYPAAGLINYFNGSNLILINKTQTAADRKADLVIYDDIAATMKAAVARMGL